MASLSTIRLRATLPISITVARRAISDTAIRYKEEPKGVHPESHASIRVSRERPVAEGAKEVEKPMSGIPKPQEPVSGTFSPRSPLPTSPVESCN
jgi:hypothetical protein